MDAIVINLIVLRNIASVIKLDQNALAVAVVEFVKMVKKLKTIKMKKKKVKKF